MITIVTGTPCTGKTTVAKRLAREKHAKYIDVNKVIKEKRLAGGYDRKRKCYIVDIKKLNFALIKIIKEARKSKENLVIDSHLSHYLPKNYVNLCIITKCGLKELKKRLEKRNYSKAKVRENLDAEIFDVCLVEAKEFGHKIRVVDSSKRQR